MKAIGQWLLVLALSLTSVGQALALDGKLFFNSTSPSRWAETQQLWEKDGILVGENLAVEKLYPIAKAIAVEDKHPAAELSDQAFAVAMARSNPGLPATGTVKAEVLRFMAQGNGIFLPTPATVAALKAGTIPASAPPVATADGTQAVAIANMEARVKALQAEVAKSSNSQKEALALAPRLRAMESQLAALKGAQAGFAKDAELTAVKEAMQKLQADVASVATLKADVDGVKSAQAGFETRLSAIEQNELMVWGTTALRTMAVLVLLGIIIALVAWHRSRAAMKVAKGADATAARVSESVEDVRQQVGLLDIKLPLDLKLLLTTLTEGASYSAVVTIDGEPKNLRFTAVEGGMVTIEGIKDQTNAVKIDKVISCIKRAANAGRVVGIDDGFGTAPLRAVR